MLLRTSRVTKNLTRCLPAKPNFLNHYSFSRTYATHKVLAEYVWIGGNYQTGDDLRSKTRTLDFKPKSAKDLPEWSFDGSSTGQASGDDSDVILKPVVVYPDPIRGENNVLVLCECYNPDGTPVTSNNRAYAKTIMDKYADYKPWFGIEQEYILFPNGSSSALGFPQGGYPKPQGPYYCGVSADRAFGRDIVEEHYQLCLRAGLQISGVNAEVCPGQWEFQIGPCLGIEAADQLWIGRFLLARLGEKYGLVISYDPKPIAGDWNGSGAHTNFSTEAMRKDGGLEVIKAACEKLGKKHKEHIAVYGIGNERRLTGKHETQSIHKFSYGVADRGSSIRIPRQTERAGKGWLEDRRPASNIDRKSVV